MARVRIEQLGDALKREGYDAADVEKIRRAVRSVSEETYNKAVVFLGLTTLFLAAGCIVLLAKEVPLPEAYWTVLGAAIGGLAGIFTAK